MRCAAFVKQPRFDVFETTPHAIREIHTQMKCPTEACPTTDQNEAVARIGHVARVVRCRSTIGVFFWSVGNFLG